MGFLILDHIMTQLQPLTDQTVDQNTVSLSAQLEQVRQDLQSILNRLNSLEVLLQRRRVRITPTLSHGPNKTVIINLFSMTPHTRNPS